MNLYHNTLLLHYHSFMTVDISVPTKIINGYILEDFGELLQKQLSDKIVYCVDGKELFIVDYNEFPPSCTITIDERDEDRIYLSFKSSTSCGIIQNT